MHGRTCARCTDLRVTYPIRTPGDLTKAIRVVRDNVADGTLLDVTQPGEIASGQFAGLAEQGLWPDYLEYHFRCSACGQGFKLTAETYHGSGGGWDVE